MERIWFWSNFDLVALQILRYIQRSSVRDMKDKVSHFVFENKGGLKSKKYTNIHWKLQQQKRERFTRKVLEQINVDEINLKT